MDARQHLQDLVKDFDTAMLVTRGTDGTLHARPMAIAEIDHEADSYFATSIDSPKIAEIERDPRVLVTFQSGSEFAAISGRATIVRDRSEIDRLWSEAWKVWFPKGKDDPNLCLLRVTAEQGEYWDNSGTEGVQGFFEGVKAYMQGRRPDYDENQHGKVQL